MAKPHPRGVMKLRRMVLMTDDGQVATRARETEDEGQTRPAVTVKDEFNLDNWRNIAAHRDESERVDAAGEVFSSPYSIF